jgi:hypothetical protein
MVYSDRPAVVSIEDFERNLKILKPQLTLLYIHQSDQPMSSKHISILADMYRLFYRYGLHVELINLIFGNNNTSSGTTTKPVSPIETDWQILKMTLEASNANFPVVYIASDQKQAFQQMFKITGNRKDCLIILNKKHEYIYFHDASLLDRTFDRTIRTYLREQTSHVSH